MATNLPSEDATFGPNVTEINPPDIELPISAPTPLVSAPTPSRGGGRGRGGRGGHRKQQTQERNEENEKRIKIYRLKYDKYMNLKPTTNSPFDVLIKATQVMNAEQFKLPPEMQPNIQLPFSWKWKEER